MERIKETNPIRRTKWYPRALRAGTKLPTNYNETTMKSTDLSALRQTIRKIIGEINDMLELHNKIYSTHGT